MGIRQRLFPPNGRRAIISIFGPDAMSQLSASAAQVSTNNASPMNRGRVYAGDGYSHKAGGPVMAPQTFQGAAAPTLFPSRATVGAGGGVSGASSLPYTGTANGVDPSLALMSATQVGSGW